MTIPKKSGVSKAKKTKPATAKRLQPKFKARTSKDKGAVERMAASSQPAAPPATEKHAGGHQTALTPKQEKFAQLIATGLNQSDAYRAAYDAKYMKAETIYSKASLLAAEGKVRARVKELRAPVVAKVQYGLEQAMDDAETARIAALLLGQTAAAVSATALKSKLNGLLVEDRHNERRPLEDLTDDELSRLLENTERDIARLQGTDPAAKLH